MGGLFQIGFFNFNSIQNIKNFDLTNTKDPRYSNSAETGFKLFGSLGNGSIGKNWL